jgi:glutamine synthetase
MLPSSLYEAILELKKNNLIQDILGEHLYRRYIDIKTKEWNEFKTQVTRWEIDKYIDI